jgi:hypothetical protein
MSHEGESKTLKQLTAELQTINTPSSHQSVVADVLTALQALPDSHPHLADRNLEMIIN